MTDARPEPEDKVVKHFREHATIEPPAHLDSLILAVAHRETPVPKPNLWQRWIRACQKPRWQVAFASLVGIALMLALVQRTPEQAPDYDFVPAPKASAPSVKKEAARALAAPAAPMADVAEPAQSDSSNAESAEEAKVAKRAAAPAITLDEQLHEVVRLQNAGQAQAADTLMKALHKRFPGENVEARLKELRRN
jgi:hypothetical protein